MTPSAGTAVSRCDLVFALPALASLSWPSVPLGSLLAVLLSLLQPFSRSHDGSLHPRHRLSLFALSEGIPFIIDTAIYHPPLQPFSPYLLVRDSLGWTHYPPVDPPRRIFAQHNSSILKFNPDSPGVRRSYLLLLPYPPSLRAVLTSLRCDTRSIVAIAVASRFPI